MSSKNVHRDVSEILCVQSVTLLLLFKMSRHFVQYCSFLVDLYHVYVIGKDPFNYLYQVTLIALGSVSLVLFWVLKMSIKSRKQLVLFTSVQFGGILESATLSKVSMIALAFSESNSLCPVHDFFITVDQWP